VFTDLFSRGPIRVKKGVKVPQPYMKSGIVELVGRVASSAQKSLTTYALVVWVDSMAPRCPDALRFLRSGVAIRAVITA